MIRHFSPKFRSVGALARIEMFEITQAGETECVSVAHFVRVESADGCMADDESLPLPWRGLKTEKVADEDAVRAGVRHQQNLAMFGLETPHR